MASLCPGNLPGARPTSFARTQIANAHFGGMGGENREMKTGETNQVHLTSRFASAVDYARHIHIERRKRTDTPYIALLLGVAALVMGEAGYTGFPGSNDPLRSSATRKLA